MKKIQKMLKRAKTQVKRIVAKTPVMAVAFVLAVAGCIWGYRCIVQHYKNTETLSQIEQVIAGARFGFLDSLYAEKTVSEDDFSPYIVSIRHVVSGVFFNDDMRRVVYDVDTRREMESITTPANVPVWVRMERPGAFTVRMTGVSYDMCKQLVQNDTGYSFAYVLGKGEAPRGSDLKENFPSGDLLISENAVDRLCVRVDETRGSIAPVQAEADNQYSKIETIADKIAVYPTLVLYYGVWDSACERDDAGTATSCFEEYEGLCRYKEFERPVGCACTLDTDCDVACALCEDNRCVLRSDAPETCAFSSFLPNPNQQCQTATILDMDGNKAPSCCENAGYKWFGDECCLPQAPYAYGEGENIVTPTCCASFAGTTDARVHDGACCLNGAEYDPVAGGFNRQTAGCCVADNGVWAGNGDAGQCCLPDSPIEKYGDSKTLSADCCSAVGGLYLSEDTDKNFKGEAICCKGSKTWDFEKGGFVVTDERCPIVCEAGETPYCVTEEVQVVNQNGMKTSVESKCLEYACCPKDGVLITDMQKPKRRQTAYCYVPAKQGRQDLKSTDLNPYCAAYDSVTGDCIAYSLCAEKPETVEFADGRRIQICPACTNISKPMFASETLWNKVCVIDTFVDRSAENIPVLNIALPDEKCCAQYKNKADRTACSCLQKGGQIMADGTCCFAGGVAPAMDSSVAQMKSYCGVMAPVATVCGCGFGGGVVFDGIGMYKDMAPGACGGPFPIADEGICCEYACNDAENGGTSCCTQGSVNKYCCAWKCRQQGLNAGDKCAWNEEAGICQYCYKGNEGE